MSLNYKISLRVKNHKENTVREIELAYWRKCDGIRDRLHPLIANLGKWKDEDENYEAVCSTSHFREIINALCEELTIFDSTLWRDSFWSGEVTRNTTYENLKVLTQMQSLFSSLLPAQRREKFMRMVDDGSLSDALIETLALVDWENSTFELFLTIPIKNVYLTFLKKYDIIFIES